MATSQPTRSALTLLLRSPTPLRPVLHLQHQQQQQQSSSPSHVRHTLAARAAPYHSTSHAPTPPPSREPESAILSSAMTHVPTHGFTPQALALGARDAGYLDISANLFPRGAFDLVLHHLSTERLALRDHKHALSPSPPDGDLFSRVRGLLLARLRANETSGVLPHLSRALGMLTLAENIPSAIRELGALGDEVCALAGDGATDGSWYARRAAVAGVYASAELFQSVDTSAGCRDTAEFLDRRLREARGVGRAVGDLGEWVGFQGGAIVGLLRSKGVRI